MRHPVILRRFAAAALAAAVLAAAVLAAAPVGAQEAGMKPIDYVEKPASDPEVARLWRDIFPLISTTGLVPPTAFIATARQRDGALLTITMFRASFICGLNECPARIFKGADLVLDFNVCDLPEAHELSADATRFVGCGVATPIVREATAN